MRIGIRLAISGLVLASILLWLLFRLREHEIPTSVAYESSSSCLAMAAG